MEEERKPQWYELARKGPQEQPHFTEAHADQVMRRLKDGSAVAEPPRPRRRAWIGAAAGILLLAGAGAVYWNQGGWAAEQGSTAATPAPTARVVKEATIDEMKASAEQMMEQYIGRTLNFQSIERGGYQRQVRLIYDGGSNGFASFWVVTETGEVTTAMMDISLTPEEAGAQLLAMGAEKLRELGYKGEYKPESVRRGVNYTAANDEPVQVIESVELSNGAANIEFVNGVYSHADFMVEEGDIRPETIQAGVEAISRLSNAQNMRFHFAFRNLSGKKNWIGLTYGNDQNMLAAVTFNYATNELISVWDSALQAPEPADPAKLAEQKEALLAMDKAPLQSAAAAVANGLFGISLENYILVKNESAPGTVTFERSNEDAPDIQASYNLDGTFYSFTKLVDPDVIY
ncbi:hypothetical protein [Paenibacillus tepidiphilus]|uniref:hypothetical protein n=1 Tax=Paenibacillus tepidiphilus TaxID=2608683 RepID=UPI00123B79FE|nr:hypothetical protein [Paenibacillus tepidiphilus]